MPLTPRRELHPKRLRPTHHLLLILIQIDRDALARYLVHRMLEPEGPQDARDLPPLRALCELDARADAPARTVVVVVAILEVLGPRVVPGRRRMLQVTVRVVCAARSVFGVVQRPVRDYDRGVFGLGES